MVRTATGNECRYLTLHAGREGSALNRPVPTQVLHLTHVSHLRTLIEQGLLADTAAQASGHLAQEIGNESVKSRRRNLRVSAGPGGLVADYAPFYFAPRSPMLSAIHHGRVPSYSDGTANLIYLVSTVERLVELDQPLVFSDRNAAKEYAKFFDNVADLDDVVDWPLMAATYWNDTAEFPDRRERRMAELLVHQRVPWDAFVEVVAQNPDCASIARQLLTTLGQSTPVNVRPEWYF